MTSPAESPGSDAFLASLAGLVHGVEGASREIAAGQIREVRLLAAAGALAERMVAGSPARVREGDMVLRSIAAELGGVLRVTDRTTQRRIDEAVTIVQDYPAALDAWEAGRIVRGHVLAIVDAGSVLPPELRGVFADAAIPRCERDTPNRVRGELEILAQHLHPRSFTERHEEAAAGRCVRIVPGHDGMSDLIATMPTAIVEGVHDRLTQMARAIVDTREERAVTGDAEVISTDARTTDQVRADLFADLLLAGTPALDDTRDTSAGPLGKIRARVQVVIPAHALAGDDHDACDLVGRSPIDAATARQLAGGNAMWERLVTHPVTGTVLAVDSYRVSEKMRRYLQARDQHCRFPGCRQAAVRCEVDHTQDHALGGKTETRNLSHLCQRHHSMKQFTAWRVRQLSGGVLEWTSPLGRIYREDAPTPAVAFTPADTRSTDAAPF
ncbi:HNH endonuclease [Microbacterium marinum]|uniref:HNH endonuclease signature motif containing protein n=1 Tax=Microbacterium marinum TaxID=421115 RepID=UPI00384F5538